MKVQCYKFWKQPRRTVKTEFYLLWLWCKSSLLLGNFLWVTHAKGILSTDILRMFIWGQEFSHLRKTDDNTIFQEALFFLGLPNWGLGEDGFDQSQQETQVKWPPHPGHRGHRALRLRPRSLLLLCSDRMPVSRDNQKQLRSKRRGFSADVFQPGNKQPPHHFSCSLQTWFFMRKQADRCVICVFTLHLKRQQKLELWLRGHQPGEKEDIKKRLRKAVLSSISSWFHSILISLIPWSVWSSELFQQVEEQHVQAISHYVPSWWIHGLSLLGLLLIYIKILIWCIISTTDLLSRGNFLWK